MPGDNIVNHPNKTHVITFTESNHLYIDNYNKKYMSVTTLISNAFPKFDADKIATDCAKKRGIKKEDLLKEWSEKGKEASRIGTRLHENMENYILGNMNNLHEPENLIEKIKFNAGFKIIDNIKLKYNPEFLEPEKLVFSPAFELAGSIDLLVKIDDKNYIIFDYKNLSKDIEKKSYMGKTGNVLPTLNILDSNYWHYALQLQIYEILLKVEKYIPNDATVTRTLNVFTDGKFSQHEMPELKQECKELIKWVHYSYFKNMKKG